MLNRSMNIYKVLITPEFGSNTCTINCQDHEILMSKRPLLDIQCGGI